MKRKTVVVKTFFFFLQGSRDRGSVISEISKEILLREIRRHGMGFKKQFKSSDLHKKGRRSEGAVFAEQVTWAHA